MKERRRRTGLREEVREIETEKEGREEENKRRNG